MTMTTIRRGVARILGFAALALVSSLTPLARRADAQHVSAVSFGSFVNALGNTARSPAATLPETGGYDVSEVQTFGVAGVVAADELVAMTTGAVDQAMSSAQSVSELQNVSVLDGLIRATNVTAIVSSYRGPSGSANNADGSGFVNLLVNGTPASGMVAPNTRIALPGVGYAVLNEQLVDDGLTVNMIHVYLQQLTGGTVNPLTGSVVGGTLTTVGEIVVGSASARVLQ
jgi:hypothetical protein